MSENVIKKMNQR